MSTNFLAPQPGIPARLHRIANTPFRNPDAIKDVADKISDFLAELAQIAREIDNTTPRSPATEKLNAILKRVRSE
jgi:hypothetical protein